MKREIRNDLTNGSKWLTPERFCALGLMAVVALVLPACNWDGHLNFFGYTTQPTYDTGIRTVYVPIFENKTFQDTTRRQLEQALTKAVIREIEAKTPYKVASSPDRADSELIGKIVSVTKSIINSNQINEVREAQTIVNVEIIWRDLRPGHLGEILSAKRQGGTQNPDPTAPPPPVVVSSIGTFVSEVGGSMSTSFQQNVDKLAVQIVSMMEKGW
jgi:hypothetical protein